MKFKLLNLNLWNGGKFFDRIVAFIRQEDPQIINFQEAYNGQGPTLPAHLRSLTELRSQLNFKYSFFSPAFLDVIPEGKIDQGNLILSRYPIVSQEAIFYDFPYQERLVHNIEQYIKTPRNLQQASIDLGDSRLNVFNTQGVWGTDGLDNIKRLEMGRLIARIVRGKKPAILTGDFNIRPNTKTISLIEQSMINLFKNELITSFNMRHKSDGGFADSVVDMVFVSPDIQVTEHYCPQVDISDHLPLVVVFKV
jgi:endonuclease/exonuclease/phosphatase family metal-dependent hydrolase